MLLASDPAGLWLRHTGGLPPLGVSSPAFKTPNFQRKSVFTVLGVKPPGAFLASLPARTVEPLREIESTESFQGFIAPAAASEHPNERRSRPVVFKQQCL